MEELDLEEFRRIKNRMAVMVARVVEAENSEEGEISDEESQRFSAEMEDFNEILSSHDLSGIPFEEYAGFYDIGFSFEGTGANLDYSIINNEFRDGRPVALKGCNVRNFDFDNIVYDDNSFDEEFKEAHKDKFLPDVITDELTRSRYYLKNLYYDDLIRVANLDGVERISDYIPDGERCVKYSEMPEFIEKFGIDIFSKIDLSGVKNFKNFHRWAKKLIKSDLTADSSKDDFDKAIADLMVEEFSTRSYEFSEVYQELENSTIFKKYHPEYIIDFGDDDYLREDFCNGRLSARSLLANWDKFAGKKYFSRVTDFSLYESLGISEEQVEYLIQNFFEVAEVYAKTDEFTRLVLLIDPSKTLDENRTSVNDFTNNLTIESARSLDSFMETMSIDEVIDKLPDDYVKSDLKNVAKYATPEQFLEYFNDGRDLFENYSRKIGKLRFAELYSIPTILEFERENGRIFTEASLFALNEIEEKFLHYTSVNDDPRISVLTRKTKENEPYDRPYTQDEFYESIRRMILKNGVTGNILTYFGLEKMNNVPFKEKFPDLFLPENAPQELKDKFYKKEMSIDDVVTYREFLNDVDLRAGFDSGVYVKYKDSYYSALEFLSLNGYSNKDIVDFIADNKYEFDFYKKYCTNDNTIELRETADSSALEMFKNGFYNKIANIIATNRIPYSEDFSQEFKDKFVTLFVSENMPEEVRKAFYSCDLTCELIKKYPEVVDELSGKMFDYMKPHSMQRIFRDRDTVMRIAQAFPEINERLDTRYPGWLDMSAGVYSTIFSNEIMLHFASKYGKYASDIFRNIDDSSIVRLSDSYFESLIQTYILAGRIQYGPDAPDLIKENHPEIFLDDNAPEELKLAYYSGYEMVGEDDKVRSSSNYVLTLKLLENHPEYFEFLQGKNLILSAKDEAFKNVALKFDLDQISEFVEKDREAVELIGKASLEKVEKFKKFLEEKPEYFAKRELIEIDGYSEDEIQQAVLTGSNDELLKRLQNKENKFRDKIISTPGLILNYPEAEIGCFNFGEYKNLMELSHFSASTNYRRGTAEQIISTMYGFFGYSDAKDLLKLPNLSEEEYAEICAQNAEKYNELYEERYYISGNLRTTNAIFNKLAPAISNRKALMNVYKSINTKITEGYDGKIENLLNDVLSENGVDVSAEKVRAIATNVMMTNTQNKLAVVSENIYSSIDGSIVETDENKKILYDTAIAVLKKTLLEYDCVDMESVASLVSKEFERTNADGTSFYSPHVTDHEAEIVEIIGKLKAHEKYGEILDNTAVDILSDEQAKIGKGWIRKLASIPESVSLKELEELESSLYGESSNIGIDTVKRIELRDSSEKSKQAVYELLAEIDSKGLLTYEKAEKMFAGFPCPYPEKFRDFFMKNKDEIIRNPKYYSKVIDMAMSFDEFVMHPMRINRFESGHLTLDEVVDNLGKASYGGKEDEYELEYRARQAGLPKQHFPFAQKIFAQMRERESQTVPTEQARRGRFVGRIVRSDDPIAIFAGNITSCCQKLGEAQPGEPSMIHSAVERNGSMFIVEEIDEFGNVVRPVAQSWTWRNGNRVCFDNVEIPDAIEGELASKNAHDEILKVYQETAERMLETDKIKMQKLLEKGKITQKQYDDVALSEVTFGTGCDDLYKHLSDEVKEGLGQASIVQPLEKDTKYTGMHTAAPWIDSGSNQFVLAKAEGGKEYTAETNIGEVPFAYGKVRNVVRYDDYDITDGLLKEVVKINEAEGRSDFVDLTDISNRDYKKMILAMSSDKDWYMVYTEKDNAIEVIDSFVAKNGKETDDVMTASLESARELLKVMQIASARDKEVISKPEMIKDNTAVAKLIENGAISSENGRLKIADRERFDKCVEILDERLDGNRRKTIQEVDER